jgi:hypothetical protein
MAQRVGREPCSQQYDLLLSSFIILAQLDGRLHIKNEPDISGRVQIEKA